MRHPVPADSCVSSRRPYLRAKIRLLVPRGDSVISETDFGLFHPENPLRKYAVGAILTATIIGAPVGIPLVILGLIICAVAIFAPFARGQARVYVTRWPN